MSAESVLVIVPARGGSKGLANKNIADLGGLPLIAHTLLAVDQAKEISDHLVSTDDSEIAEIARKYGGIVQNMRPIDLARDDTRISDVVRYLLDDSQSTHDYIMLLQPTAPLRLPSDIDGAIRLARERDADSVVSLSVVDTYHPWTMYYVDDNRMWPVGSDDHAQPRQEYPTVGWRNGAIYLVKREVFLAEDTFVTPDCIPYLMPHERSVNIDTEEDLWLAERYLMKSKNESDSMSRMSTANVSAKKL